MRVAYRHDTHKLRGRSHDHAQEEFRDVRVNEEVPLFADRDAALLSRPRGKPEQTLPAHESPRRLPLLEGEFVDTHVGNVADAAYDLVRIDDAAAQHEAWLDATVPAMFSESRNYPYTSLKYHTLLTAALLDNYRAVHPFGELFLEVSTHDVNDGPRIIPHRTVLTTSTFVLHITADPDGPAARIGDCPARNFADTWGRLPVVPFDVDTKRCWRVLDAQLRRIRSWSTALQYIEAFSTAIERQHTATPVGWWA